MSKHLSLITFFIDFNDLHCTSGNFFEKISDHLPNFLIIEKLSYHLKKKKSLIKETNFNKLINFNEENLRKDIGKLNLTENILNINDLNKKYAFHENLMQVVNKNVPLKEMSNKEIKMKKKPWTTKEIIMSIHKRNSYLKNLGTQITNSSLSDTNAIEIK